LLSEIEKYYLLNEKKEIMDLENYIKYRDLSYDRCSKNFNIEDI